jgi:hypothetical protein
MGYDYSVGFLKKYSELAQKLQQIATSGELLVYESTDWDEIKKRQRLVNEVLANMARNVEGSEGIRTVLRAWTAFKNEDTYQLFIGQPNHKVAGRPPGKPKQSMDWFKQYVKAADVESLVYRHDRKITIGDTDALTVFIGKIYALAKNPAYHRAEFTIGIGDEETLVNPDELVEYLAEVCMPIGWDKNARLEGLTFIVEKD